MYGEEQTTLDFVEEYDVLEIYFFEKWFEVFYSR